MSICPKDGSACCDDLCHGAGCLQMDGYQMLDICHVCKGTIDHEIEDCGTCTCDDDFYCDDYSNEREESPGASSTTGVEG